MFALNADFSCIFKVFTYSVPLLAHSALYCNVLFNLVSQLSAIVVIGEHHQMWSLTGLFKGKQSKYIFISILISRRRYMLTQGQGQTSLTRLNAACCCLRNNSSRARALYSSIHWLSSTRGNNNRHNVCCSHMYLTFGNCHFFWDKIAPLKTK